MATKTYPANGPAKDSPDVFDAYQAKVEMLYGGKPGHKNLTQALSQRLAVGFQDKAFVEQLHTCFASARWTTPSSDKRSNWIWRPQDTDHTAEPGEEVKLERAIAERDGFKNWTFQMSTMSGVFDGWAHRRRAIDLVHRVSADEFEFIELKVGSNNPVSAAFEILGYGLAYCHARAFADEHSKPSDYDVLRARKIRLVVLAPRKWYRFNLRGKEEQDYRLDQFSGALGAGLDHLRERISLPGLDNLDFQYRYFVSFDSLLDQVARGERGGEPLFSELKPAA